MEKLKRLFSRREIPVEARDLLRGAETPRDLLTGLDELITRNEVEVDRINREIEALEDVEGPEVGRVRGGELPERSKNNVLRRIQRLRKQMDNLEDRLRIYNRNINLQIHLVGKIQALEAMELRGVDEEKIDSILFEYEEELNNYRSVLDTEDIAVTDIGRAIDDSEDLAAIETEILGVTPEEAPAKSPAATTSAARARERRVPAAAAPRGPADDPEKEPAGRKTVEKPEATPSQSAPKESEA
ncbi:MAG: hypothetical protein ACE5GW_00205 [Planctomycetota bacterium]